MSRSARHTLHITYLGVRDPDYPRNQSLRHGLASRGWVVDAVARPGSRLLPLRWLRTVLQLSARSRRGGRAVILSEFSNDLAPAAWLWCRLTRQVFVVDMFTGQFETKVEDRKLYRNGSPRARLALAQDRFAIRGSDLYLTDTAAHACVFDTYVAHRHSSLSIPAGLPPWARERAPRASDDTDSGQPTILYFGNFVPLHGISHLISALRLLGDRIDRRWSLVIVGRGQDDHLMAEAIPDLSAMYAVTRLAWLDGDELREVLWRASVVVGVFGTGLKARSVIPNKVLQALAVGSRVVTVGSEVYQELPAEALELVHLVSGTDSNETANALAEAASTAPIDAASVDAVREALGERLEAGVDELSEFLRSGGWRGEAPATGTAPDGARP